MEREDLEAIAEVILEKDLFVISDEIYGELTYKEDHVSIANIPGMQERTILINGFSKSYAMTGWRLGSLPLCARPQQASMRQWKPCATAMRMSGKCARPITREDVI